MAYANGGRVSLVDKGAYSSSITYNRLDYVKYNSEVYIAKKTTLNHTPNGDDEYWTRLAKLNTEISDSEWVSIQNLYQ